MILSSACYHPILTSIVPCQLTCGPLQYPIFCGSHAEDDSGPLARTASSELGVWSYLPGPVIAKLDQEEVFYDRLSKVCQIC